MENTLELRATKKSGWFKDWFDTSFYHKLYAHRDEEEAIGFINALLLKLKPSSSSHMHDLGCGAGRHAKYLASKGFNVTGTDLALSSIRAAKRSATANLGFYQHDMRLPFGNNQFDYIFNFFTSFGYFEDEQENFNVMLNIFNALKPGGVLVMDYINAARAESQLVGEEEKKIEGAVYKINRWSDKRFIYKKIQIDDVAGPMEYTEQIIKFDLHDFRDIFRSLGMTLECVYGDYRLNEYDVKNSPRLIMVVKK